MFKLINFIGFLYKGWENHSKAKSPDASHEYPSQSNRSEKKVTQCAESIEQIKEEKTLNYPDSKQHTILVLGS